MLHAKNLDTSIGKIVKMWGTPTGEKKLRIIWFFWPRDVIGVLGDHVSKWNVLFLACGEGQGLKDTAEVGNVLGKCNVICRSDDPRNPAASVSAENKADFYFSFTFDVGTKKASKHFPDQVDKVRIEEFFNTSKSQQRDSSLPQKRHVRFDDTDFTSASQKPKDGLYKQDSAGVVNSLFDKNTMIEKDGSQRTLRHPGDARPTSSVANQPLKKRVLNQSVHSDEEDKAMRIKQDRVNVSVDHPLKKRGLNQSLHSDEEDKAMRFKQSLANVSADHPLKKRGLNYSVHQDEEDTANPVRKRINLGLGNASVPLSVQKESRRDAPDVSGTLTVNRDHSHGTRRLHNGDEVLTTAKVVRGGEKAGSKVIEVTKKPILLPVGVNDTELEEHIIQHLAAAAAMGRARHLSRREGHRNRSSDHGHPHFLVFSAQPTTHAGPASPERGEGEPHTLTSGASPSSPLVIGEQSVYIPATQSTQSYIVSSAGPSSAANQHGTSPHNQMLPTQAPGNQDRAGPSDLQSFSEALKSRLNAVSTRYKESISKSTRGWKERWFSRNSPIADLGSQSQVVRETNAGVAAVSPVSVETRDIGSSLDSAPSVSDVDSVSGPPSERQLSETGIDSGGNHVNEASQSGGSHLSESCIETPLGSS